MFRLMRRDTRRRMPLTGSSRYRWRCRRDSWVARTKTIGKITDEFGLSGLLLFCLFGDNLPPRSVPMTSVTRSSDGYTTDLHHSQPERCR